MSEQVGWLGRALAARSAVLGALRSGAGDVEVLSTWVAMLDQVIRNGGQS